MRQVAVGSVVLRVAIGGDGPPLLLFNGIGGNLEMWGALLRHLPGRRIVMFDFPGTGGSLPLPKRRRMPALTELVVGLLDALGLQQVDVLGYSWGGALAQELAHCAPARVRSLVLAATVPGVFGQPPPPWVLAAMSTPMRYYSRTYMRLVAPIVYGVAIRSDEGHLDARRQRPPSLRGYAHQLYAITGWSSRGWLKMLRLPVLVLSGRGDQLARSATAGSCRGRSAARRCSWCRGVTCSCCRTSGSRLRRYFASSTSLTAARDPSRTGTWVRTGSWAPGPRRRSPARPPAQGSARPGPRPPAVALLVQVVEDDRLKDAAGVEAERVHVGRAGEGADDLDRRQHPARSRGVKVPLRLLRAGVAPAHEEHLHALATACSTKLRPGRRSRK